jgi:hypothetical protein
MHKHRGDQTTQSRNGFAKETVCFLGLFNDTVSTTWATLRHVTNSLNYVLQSIRNEAFSAYFNVQSEYLRRGTEKNSENPHAV